MTTAVNKMSKMIQEVKVPIRKAAVTNKIL